MKFATGELNMVEDWKLKKKNRNIMFEIQIPLVDI